MVLSSFHPGELGISLPKMSDIKKTTSHPDLGKTRFMNTIPTNAQAPPPSKSFPLSMASPGERIVITEILGGRTLLERLLAMGISCADEVEVVQRHDHGGVVVAKNGTRYALGGGMAHKISVTRM